jgi:hypothetical protein
MFSKSDELELLNYSDNEIVMSANWSGKIQPQNDLVMELFEEITFPMRRHIKYFTNMYVNANVYVVAGGPDHIMSGARPGTHNSWIRKGTEQKIILDEKSNTLIIGNAIFKVIA